MSESITYTIVVVGDRYVGKTSYIQHLISGNFNEEYDRSPSITVHPVVFYTSYGPVTFNVWVIPDQETLFIYMNLCRLRPDCAILMFDLTQSATYHSIPMMYRTITDACGAIPMALCGNKVDVRERVVLPRQINHHRTYGLHYFDMSAKRKYNFTNPFLWLARRLTGHLDLEFVDPSTIPPPPVALNDEVPLNEDTQELENLSREMNGMMLSNLR